MASTRTVAAGPGDAGARLDLFLAGALPDLSRTRLKGLIEEGAVLLDGRSGRPGLRLKGHETITVVVPDAAPPAILPEVRPLSVLFEDPHLMIGEKPAGSVVHPSAGHAAGTLVNVLLARADRLSGIGGVARPGIVHRLDKDTSGLLVVAKTDAAHGKLCAMFAAHALLRMYRAIVFGRPPQASGTVETQLGRHPVHRKKMAVVAAGGRRAVTRYRLVETFGGFSLVEFRLETGRTHQVRLHCAHLRCPIVGDDVYGRPRLVPLGPGGRAPGIRVDRFLLHAFRIAFPHPVTGEPLDYAVPDPPEFAAFRDAALAAARP